MPKITIIPSAGHISIDDHPVTVSPEAMPAGVDLPGFALDPNRPIEVIHFDGVFGVIERRSRAPGKRDTEHFLGGECLAAYRELHAAEVKRQADERAAQAAEQEAVIAATRKAAEAAK